MCRKTITITLGSFTHGDGHRACRAVSLTCLTGDHKRSVALVVSQVDVNMFHFTQHFDHNEITTKTEVSERRLCFDSRGKGKEERVVKK